MKRVFLVHGWDGSPRKGWFPWLKSELQEKKFHVVTKKMPTNIPIMRKWVPYLKGLVGIGNKKTFFVGHSAGCITILRYLEMLNRKEKVGGVVLVAGFTDDLGFKELSNYFLEPINWKKIRSKCKKFVAINSDNDQWVSLKHGRIFKDKLGAKLIIEHNKGHIDDVKRLNSLLNSVLEISE